MRRLRAGWLSFRRIHLAALVADWRRTLLSVIGVAVGVTVVLGVVILKTELVRPFDAFGPSLTHAADHGVVEVTPNVSGRLPMATIDRLRAEVTGADAVIPIVASLTPVAGPGGSSAASPARMASFAGRIMPGRVAGRRLQLRATCPRPGARGRSWRAAADADGNRAAAWSAARPRVAYSRPAAWVGAPGLGVSGIRECKSINDGYVLLAPSVDTAATMLGSPGYATAAFVVPKPGAEITADIDRVIAGVATAGPPRPQQPAVFANAAQGLNLNVLVGILIGLLIAMNTILLAVEDRRAVMGTIGAVGAKPVGLFGGMLGEGAVTGALGGLLGVPSGFLFGTYLVNEFGRAMLAGSGGTVAAHFTPSLIAIGVAAGIACGILAMIGPAVRLARDGPLASMASAGGVQRARAIPMWPLIAGVGMLAAAVVVSKIFGRGSLPLDVGVYTMSLWQFGVAFVTAWVAPCAAGVIIELLTVARPDVGRLLRADVRRYTLLFALSAALLAVGTSMAIGSQSMQLLGTRAGCGAKA